MLFEDGRNRVRVAKPFLQLTTRGECRYQFDFGSWIVFDTIADASKFMQARLNVAAPDAAGEKITGPAVAKSPDSKASKP